MMRQNMFVFFEKSVYLENNNVAYTLMTEHNSLITMKGKLQVALRLK